MMEIGRNDGVGDAGHTASSGKGGGGDREAEQEEVVAVRW